MGTRGEVRQFDGKVKLQGIPGERDAYSTKNLRPGDIIGYNFGYTSKVVSVTPSKSGKSYTLVVKSSSTGEEFTRKTSPDRLWAIEKKESFKK